ncbi:MAG: class I SAM-dependent methyltransferase [Nitrospiraceae bacterium]
MTDGHPELIRVIADEIQRTGPVPFARFMELALYHPEFGYYMRAGEQGGERIGWQGDYYTSSDVHPVLARALVRQARQADDLLGRPDPVTVIEMGAGKGLFARDFLDESAKQHGSFWDRLRYVLIERSPAMRASQRSNLAPWLELPGRVSWVNDLQELGDGSVAGVMLSNELVDAFPVHRIKIERGQVREIFVDYQGGRFCERLEAPSTPEVSVYLRRLSLSLPEGYTAEINLEALTWMKEVARVLGRGLVMTIDYGHIAQDLYGPDRRRGTLLCYYAQMASEDPYRRVGLQDMTAHVDFTSLAAIGEEAGLQVTGFTNQMSFLMGLGVEQWLEALEPGSAEFQSVVQVLRPEGMGRTFKILIQHKGIEKPELEGLRVKPFFGEALAQAMGNRR